MLERVRRLLPTRPRCPRLHWLSTDIVMSHGRRSEDWQTFYDAGVRAVVDLGPEDAAQAATVRSHGMRYLNAGVEKGRIVCPDQLQIVASWIVERSREDGRVLIQDGGRPANDGLVAVAALVRGGLPAHLALLALRRARPTPALNRAQHAQLVRFVAAQPAAG